MQPLVVIEHLDPFEDRLAGLVARRESGSAGVDAGRHGTGDWALPHPFYPPWVRGAGMPLGQLAMIWEMRSAAWPSHFSGRFGGPGGAVRAVW